MAAVPVHAARSVPASPRNASCMLITRNGGCRCSAAVPGESAARSRATSSSVTATWSRYEAPTVYHSSSRNSGLCSGPPKSPSRKLRASWKMLPEPAASRRFIQSSGEGARYVSTLPPAAGWNSVRKTSMAGSGIRNGQRQGVSTSTCPRAEKNARISRTNRSERARRARRSVCMVSDYRGRPPGRKGRPRPPLPGVPLRAEERPSRWTVRGIARIVGTVKGATISGFQQLAERAVDEYRCRARVFRHTATGCEVLHLAAADTENLFAFSFATPAGDDTGAAHILEHSVLAGSARFPLREPFTVLMRGSVSTFLNAFTWPDRTVYPAASCTPRDFFNLLDVYGDAVFFPLLRDETFRQEGWRLERPPADRFAGVVLNEMKGAYASPEALAGEWALRGLFPDTPLGRDNGGDPRAIPTLTPEGLRAYHRRWYHPSNCRIILYGDVPVEEELAFLQDRFLCSFSAERIDARPAEPCPGRPPRGSSGRSPLPAAPRRSAAARWRSAGSGRRSSTGTTSSPSRCCPTRSWAPPAPPCGRRSPTRASGRTWRP